MQVALSIVVAVGIKYSKTEPSNQLRPIRNFIREQNCRFGIVINNDESPRLYEEQLVGIPFTCI